MLVLTGIFLTILTVAVYRLKLHPLAEYPGPLAGRLTDWYSVYHAIKGDRHLDFYHLHQQHGDIVRYGPNRISVCSNTGLKTIYGFNANIRKSDWYHIYKIAFDVPNVLTLIDGERHAFKRRIISQTLSQASIKSMEGHILKNARILCQQLCDTGSPHAWSSPKNMSDLVSYVNSDIMGDLCFGRNWNVLERTENRDLLEAFKNGSGAVNIGGNMPWILKLKSDWSFLGKYIDGARRFKTVTTVQSNARIAAENDDVEHKDVFAALLKAKDPDTGRSFTKSEMVSEAGFLLIAGSDTSRVALTATIFHCVHNPTTLDLLKTEVRGAFQTPDDICVGQRLSSCQYLRACIDEAMRLSPSIGSINPRQPLAGGIAVDGHFFPEGTDLGTPIYAIHHQERYYPNAFAFKPARWIVDESISGSEDEVALAHSAFAPFMIGPRACVGKVLAYTEIMILLARIVFSFDLRLSADSSEGIPSWAKGRSNKEDFHIFDSVIALHDGPMVEFKPREFSAC